MNKFKSSKLIPSITGLFALNNTSFKSRFKLYSCVLPHKLRFLLQYQMFNKVEIFIYKYQYKFTFNKKS